MIILDIEGQSLTQEDKEILLHPAVSGLIFFSRNFASRDQMTELAREMKSLRSDLILCVDQEGGRVQRFIDGFTRLPPLGVLGQLIDEGSDLNDVAKLSEHLGALMALEIRALGIDLSFAPILDLNKGVSDIIGNRAIHSDPIIVTSLASAYIKGMSHAGMQATGKHFPGHGSVALDSHIGLPEDHRSVAEIFEDMLPFCELAKQNIPALMTAHIVYPKIDADPVSFSRYWLQTVLREQIGYQGAIISDDLSMGGAQGMGSYLERANRALDAGCDLILVCNNREGAEQVIDGIAINDDPISQQRRLNLLANKSVPNFSELKDFALYKDAESTLMRQLG